MVFGFLRRKPDPHVEEAARAIVEWLAPLLESYGARDVKTKVTRDSAEALGKSDSKPDMTGFTASLLQLTLATLHSRGWRIEKVEGLGAASSVSSPPGVTVADLTAGGLAPAVLEALERAGVKVDSLKTVFREYKVDLGGVYRIVDAGEAVVEAVSPGGEGYSVSVETMWIMKRLGAAVRFKKK